MMTMHNRLYMFVLVPMCTPFLKGTKLLIALDPGQDTGDAGALGIRYCPVRDKVVCEGLNP